MQKVEFDQIQESLFFEELPNGLSVYVLPKKNFFKTYATFTTKYGSIDNTFRVKGKEKHEVPDGIAHFLEHKMFEQASGEDVFQEFSRQGASANAFTSFTRTAYLFSSTGQVEKNLTTLLDFVQSRRILRSKMWRKKKGLSDRKSGCTMTTRTGVLILACLKPCITIIRLRLTSPEPWSPFRRLPKTCCTLAMKPFTIRTTWFCLLWAGGPGSHHRTGERKPKEQVFSGSAEIERFFPDEPEEVAEALKEMELSVGISKCMFGFKEKADKVNVKGNEFLKQEMATQIALEALLGPASNLYQSLYDDGLIDDGFGTDYTLDRGFGLSIIGGDTPDPDQLLERIKKELPPLIEKGLDQETFERIRKKKIGANLRYLNSPEWIANQFTGYRFHDADLFNLVPCLEALTLEEVNRRMQEHMQWDRFAVSIVRPSQD